MTHHLYDDVASSSESRHVYLHLFHYRYFVCVCVQLVAVEDRMQRHPFNITFL